MNHHFFERPILNSPFAHPARPWELDLDGQPTEHADLFAKNLLDILRGDELANVGVRDERSDATARKPQASSGD